MPAVKIQRPTRQTLIRGALLVFSSVGLTLVCAEEYLRTELWRENCQYQADHLFEKAKALAEVADPACIAKWEAQGLDPAKVAWARANIRTNRERASLCLRRRRKWLLGVWFPWVDIKPDPSVDMPAR